MDNTDIGFLYEDALVEYLHGDCCHFNLPICDCDLKPAEIRFLPVREVVGHNDDDGNLVIDDIFFDECIS